MQRQVCKLQTVFTKSVTQYVILDDKMVNFFLNLFLNL